MTARYENGKIYKLVNDVDSEIYVGSSCLELRKRLYYHKRTAKSAPDRKVYKHILNIGWDNVSIILIETYPCMSKNELLRRERHWIDELKPSLNQCIPTRTKQEYRIDNRDHILAIKKQYRIDKQDHIKQHNLETRDHILAYKKQHYKDNPDKYKEYHTANRDHILEQRRQYRIANHDHVLAQEKRYREAKKQQVLQKTNIVHTTNTP